MGEQGPTSFQLIYYFNLQNCRYRFPNSGLETARKLAVSKPWLKLRLLAHTVCEAGRFQSLTGQTFCDICGNGKLSSENRQYCAACGPGQHTVNNLECQDCGPGRYAPTAQDDECLSCSPGRFAESYASSSCLDCETEFGLGSGSVEGSSLCRECRAGYFHAGGQTTTSHHECAACPEGLACDAPGLTTSTVVLEPGYWRTSRDSLAILFCRTGWCTGGVGAGDMLCEEGHAGPRCGLCSQGYFKSIASSCQPCKQIAVGLSVGLIAAALVLIVVLWKCVITRLGKWARRRLRAFGKTMFVFVQVIATLPGIIQMPIPVIFVELMKILKVPALDLLLENLGLACVVDTNHFLQLIVMTTLPSALILFVFLRNLFVTRCNPFRAATRTTGQGTKQSQNARNEIPSTNLNLRAQMGILAFFVGDQKKQEKGEKRK